MGLRCHLNTKAFHTQMGLSGIQMAFENQTIWHPPSFLPFKYRTSSVFRSPLFETSGILLFRCFRYSYVSYSDPHSTLKIIQLLSACNTNFDFLYDRIDFKVMF